MKLSHELSISFWLRSKRKNPGPKATIMCRILINGEREDFSLGYQVEPEKFDNKAATISGRTAEVVEINKHIMHVRAELVRHYNALREKGVSVTSALLLNAYKGIAREKKTILQVVDYHNERFKEKVDGDKRSGDTLKKWKTTRDKIAAFIKHEFKLPDLPLEKIDYPFAEDFFDYLTLKDGLTDNTAMKYMKNTKQLMKLAVKRKWIDSSPIQDYVCSYVNPDRDILNIDELSILYHKKMPMPRLEEAKDVYIFMVCTGYAYKDAELLEPDNRVKYFDGEDWIIKNREKTWCRENVPLLPMAKAILDKYKDHPYCMANGRLLPVKSNQRFNGYLKEIADICCIKKNLTTHTARHTFATTITLANGVPIETVSAMLGHKSLRTTQIYAKIVASKVANDMKVLRDKFKLDLPASMIKKLTA